MERIKAKWLSARKLYGLNSEIITVSGVKVSGRYILCESGMVTPSHNPLMQFQKSEGFPTDRNGNSVNDRDYERDADAQSITRNIAMNYDSRALQSQVIVSPDGIVLSGNGRTMAGLLAARDNTDKAYIEYLQKFSMQYGFFPEDVNSFEHPRVVFETSESYPYTTDTFAMFNAQEVKSQSKTELAVKMGKLVNDDVFKRLILNINQYDSINDFYANTRSSTEAVNELRNAGLISQMQYPEMFDGGTISQQAKEILENVLIGKAFETNLDSVRQITAFKGMRKNIITALAEISNNVCLKDYSLEIEMAQAISLCYQARACGAFKQGDVVSSFARQMTLFGDTTTVADYHNPVVLMLADMINSNQTARLKKTYVMYNNNAKEAASGQTNFFSDGAVKTKQEILDEITSLMKYGSRKEISESLNAATEKRKIDAYNDIQQSLDGGSADTCQSLTPNSFIGLQLPCGEVITAKLEYLNEGKAGVRVKGWNRFFVSQDLIVNSPCLNKLSLPKWLCVGTTLSNGLCITEVSRHSVKLSDGNEYDYSDILLSCTPSLALAV